MRLGIAVAVMMTLGCSAKQPSSTMPRSLDEDLPKDGAGDASATGPAAAALAPRVVAPKGKGLRTGTIARASLIATLDAGPGMFLRQLEVTPERRGESFVGWQLVQFLDAKSPLVDADLVPGDVLLTINHMALSRPDQLQTLWDSLRTANEVTAQLWRGNARFELHFVIEPRVAAATPPPPTPRAPSGTVSAMSMSMSAQ